MSMSGYTKLFNSILASTIWRADDKTRLVWITLLAMADKNGAVEGSIPGLADFARVSLDDCLQALTHLQSPDEFSRSKEYDGRRIEIIDGGWRLINHGKYRAKMGSDERREYLKLKQREYRRKQKSTNVNNVSYKSTLLTHAEADTEADTEASKKELSSADADFERFRDAYPVSRRVGGKAGKSAFKTATHGKNGTHFAVMLEALEQQKHSEQWQTPKLIPLMTTWLNQERWLQSLPPAPVNQTPWCQHTPPCRAEQIHRKKLQAERLT